ncbi:hypothetical protein [Asticcacaulis solisilvae]|uniref:hypothetical protein n=1 Tax=Asticcacaulis solisilvae TaxID=1217274 RepID=UPI003FD85A11
MMKLSPLCAGLTALVLLAGCGDRKPAPDSASGGSDAPGVVDGAFLPHEGDVTSAAVSASAAASDSASADPGDPVRVNAERQTEAPHLKADAAIASRQGDVLTIRINGQPAARFTDQRNLYCEGSDTCSIWTYAGTVVVGDGHGGKQTLPAVYQDNGEGSGAVIIERTGKLTWFGNMPMPSPDGRFLAAEPDETYDGARLQITDWFSPGHQTTVTFDGDPCTPVRWTTATTLTADCGSEDGTTKRKPATVTKDHGHWRLVEVVAPAIPRKGRIKAKPQQTKIIDGKTDVLDSPQQRADADAYDRTAGYLRLALPDGP